MIDQVHNLSFQNIVALIQHRVYDHIIVPKQWTIIAFTDEYNERIEECDSFSSRIPCDNRES